MTEEQPLHSTTSDERDGWADAAAATAVIALVVATAVYWLSTFPA